MLHNIPEFDHYHVAYLKDDPAKEPIVVGDSSPAALADASRKLEDQNRILNFDGLAGTNMRS
jgi:hypothetical protein